MTNIQPLSRRSFNLGPSSLLRPGGLSHAPPPTNNISSRIMRRRTSVTKSIISNTSTSCSSLDSLGDNITMLEDIVLNPVHYHKQQQHRDERYQDFEHFLSSSSTRRPLKRASTTPTASSGTGEKRRESFTQKLMTTFTNRRRSSCSCSVPSFSNFTLTTSGSSKKITMTSNDDYDDELTPSNHWYGITSRIDWQEDDGHDSALLIQEVLENIANDPELWSSMKSAVRSSNLVTSAGTVEFLVREVIRPKMEEMREEQQRRREMMESSNKRNGKQGRRPVIHKHMSPFF